MTIEQRARELLGILELAFVTFGGFFYKKIYPIYFEGL